MVVMLFDCARLCNASWASATDNIRLLVLWVIRIVRVGRVMRDLFGEGVCDGSLVYNMLHVVGAVF